MVPAMMRLLVSSLFLLLFAAAACAQTMPTAVKPGDRWVYDSVNGKRSLRVDSVSGDGTIDATVDAPGLSGLPMKYTQNWNVLMAPVVMLGNVRYQRYSPPVCLMPAPPWNVGANWSCEFELERWHGIRARFMSWVSSRRWRKSRCQPALSMRFTPNVNVGGTEVDCWYAPAGRELGAMQIEARQLQLQADFLHSNSATVKWMRRKINFAQRDSKS